MSLALQLRVEPLSTMRAVAARRLSLTPMQGVYAGDIAFHVDDAMAAPGSDAMMVLYGEHLIGFYRLDYANPTTATPACDHAAVGLRAFALDAGWQGRGLGLPTLEACCADLTRRRPAHPWLALYVHTANTIARRLYLRAGFTDRGPPLVGGSGGPEQRMLRPLGVGQCAP